MLRLSFVHSETLVDPNTVSCFFTIEAWLLKTNLEVLNTALLEATYSTEKEEDIVREI